MKTNEVINFVAGKFFSPEDNLSSYDQYMKLLEVDDKNDLAMNHVNVWHPFENHTVGDLIELIECEEENHNQMINQYF